MKRINKIQENFRLGNIEVAKADLPSKYTWDKAMRLQANRWRLPTKEELSSMYRNRNKIGGFDDDFYWSSSEISEFYAWSQHFGEGNEYDSYKIANCRVRLIRDI